MPTKEEAAGYCDALPFVLSEIETGIATLSPGQAATAQRITIAIDNLIEARIAIARAEWVSDLRDRFAGKMLQAMMSDQREGSPWYEWTIHQLAKRAYEIADEALAARDA